MTFRFSWSRRLFIGFNYVLLIGTAIVCIIPILHMLALSFSPGWASDSGMVGLWPVAFTWKAYSFVVDKPEYFMAFWVSIKRIMLGLPINMLLTVLAAYPLSRKLHQFRARRWYVYYFLIPMLFGGGLIPTYMIVSKTELINTIWALVLPGAVPIFNVILLMNFFRELPEELEESAFIDGAGFLTTLVHICLPLAKPALATLVLFTFVGHWNSWFDGILYMNRSENYPLQSYLQTIVIQADLNVSMLGAEDVKRMFADIGQSNTRAAKIFIAMIPVLILYPFLQKYFAKGILLGSVKG